MADYNTEQFEKDCKALGVTLSDEQIQQFLKYYEMLVEWNEVMNLTAITEYDEVMKKHFVDSISLCKAYDVTQNKTVIDVGTGAGFPGLALKIAFPDLQVTLQGRLPFLSRSGRRWISVHSKDTIIRNFPGIRHIRDGSTAAVHCRFRKARAERNSFAETLPDMKKCYTT